MITLIVLLIIVGVVLQFLREYIEPKLFTAIIIIIVLAVALALLNMFGLLSGVGSTPLLR